MNFYNLHHPQNPSIFYSNPKILEIVANKMDNNDILTIKELALYLKLAEKTAYRLASDGKLPGFKVGGAWRFRQEEINRWIKEQEKRSF